MTTIGGLGWSVFSVLVCVFFINQKLEVQMPKSKLQIKLKVQNPKQFCHLDFRFDLPAPLNPKDCSGIFEL